MSITVDHTIYAPSDTIIATITNTLDTTIYIRSGPGCPTLVLRRKVDGDWQAISLCQTTEVAPSVSSYSISAHTSVPDNLPISGLPATLPDGTYRIGLAYSTLKPDPDPRSPLQSGAMAWSATFEVCTCRSC
ncbi:MAG: immunoglobulin-like domain-containing protein [Ktedonobacterales bacterium]